jgi:hypothetical protein
VKTVPAEFVENARPLDPPVVWEISAFAAGERWSPQNAELVAALRGADWERRRPKGAVQVRLERLGEAAARRQSTRSPRATP